MLCKYHGWMYMFLRSCVSCARYLWQFASSWSSRLEALNESVSNKLLLICMLCLFRYSLTKLSASYKSGVKNSIQVAIHLVKEKMMGSSLLGRIPPHVITNSLVHVLVTHNFILSAISRPRVIFTSVIRLI
jgi:hypothetical protein